MKIPKLTDRQKEITRKINQNLRKFNDALSLLEQIEEVKL